MTRKFLFIFFVATIFSGCRLQSGESSASSTQAATRPQTSGNPVCEIDLSYKENLADKGDLQSARDLRAYFSDCMNHGYADELRRWGLLAAKFGNRNDEKEYMLIIAEENYDKPGTTGWLFPSCGELDLAATEKQVKKNDLKATRDLIAYRIQCDDSGISDEILSLAKNAANIGSADDKNFLDELMKAKGDGVSHP